MKAPDFQFDGPEDAALTFALAHGAGAGMDSDFMAYFAAELATRGLRVARFEFPYMVKRREDGRRRPPDRAPVLLDAWRAVIAALGRDSLVVGGKSMGGRIASHIVAETEAAGTPVRGAIYLGYPFHAPGKPDAVRDDALAAARTPSLLLQGERDPFGTRGEVAGYRLGPGLRVHWLADGDHSFVPRNASGRTRTQNWEEAVRAIREFVAAL